jgi:UPF0755 protein
MKTLGRLFILVLLLGVGAGAYLLYTLGSPYAAFDKEVFVDIPAGTSTQQMADLLQANGVIRSRWSFMLARLLNGRATLKAGEYRFNQPASVMAVFGRIAKGDIFYYELLTPEGSTQFDIASALQQMGVMKAQDFLKAAASPAMIKDLDPKAPSLEGYLFPATYRLTRHTTAQQICEEMTARFRRAWKEIAPAEANVHGVVTLASLVEKETAISGDRPKVASVFRNRLDKGMTLDCDPTTIYAAIVEKRYKGVIHRSDLDSMNEYNTYKHAGLPPGPIANPGMDSLKAALSPADTDYLYFVAKPGGSGQHVFSGNLADHTTAVQAYRRGLKK